MINADACSCCGEIWNRENLKNIPLGKYELHLCPDCYGEYIKPFKAVKAEIQENINYNKRMNYQGIVAGLLLTLDIIDKYKTESEE